MGLTGDMRAKARGEPHLAPLTRTAAPAAVARYDAAEVAKCIQTDTFEVNFSGHNPANVTLNLQSGTVRGNGSTVENYTVFTIGTDGKTRSPSASEMVALRDGLKALVAKRSASPVGMKPDISYAISLSADAVAKIAQTSLTPQPAPAHPVDSSTVPAISRSPGAAKPISLHP